MSKLEKTALLVALLTVAEAAELLNVKEPTIRAWIARRKLAYTKLGRSVRIPRDAIEQMVRDGMVPASR
jgi:excisionase family DNA binding protein